MGFWPHNAYGESKAAARLKFQTGVLSFMARKMQRLLNFNRDRCNTGSVCDRIHEE
jgi:hypothetical protein